MGNGGRTGIGALDGRAQRPAVAIIERVT